MSANRIRVVIPSVRLAPAHSAPPSVTFPVDVRKYTKLFALWIFTVHDPPYAVPLIVVLSQGAMLPS
jgi:hypothetical protein